MDGRAAAGTGFAVGFGTTAGAARLPACTTGWGCTDAELGCVVAAGGWLLGGGTVGFVGAAASDK